MVRPRTFFGVILVLIIATACSCAPRAPKLAEAPKPEQPAQTSGQPSNLPVEPPGWRYITTTDSDMMRLVSTEPNGHGFFMTSNVLGGRDGDLMVTVGDQIKISIPPFRQVTFATPAHWQADIVQLPWGTVTLEAGSDRGNEWGGVISPDLRYAAIPLYAGLWVGDVQTGNGQIITSPLPSNPPTDMGPGNHLIWVAQPHWSPDSRWIYFQSNRQKPYALTWWRIAVSGGVEEPVAGEVLGDRTPTDSEMKLWQSTAKRIQTDGFFFRELSPDGHWAAADKTDSASFRLYNLDRPEASITYTGPTNYLAGTGYGAWSPDSSKIIFHQRAANRVAPEMGILTLQAGVVTAFFYEFPAAGSGKATARGFVGNDHLLVSLQPWNDSQTDAEAPTQWWLLDLKAVTPTRISTVPWSG